jgi:GntR family transcriptional regulator/MocR family aminotransferase
MRIPLDRQSHIPLYQQLEAYLRQAILTGSLIPQTRLPATRQLARDLGVNRVTVENAYAELEADGLIFTRQGSGTFVLTPPEQTPLSLHQPGAPWPLWQQDLQRHSAIKSGILFTSPPGLIDFASGGGDPNLFPIQDFRKIIQQVIQRDGFNALKYGDPAGYSPLRATIAQVLASQGLQTQPENILITTGSQQAMALVSLLLLRPGDAVLIESPSYLGAITLFQSLGLKLVTIPCDEQGMQVEKLEPLLQTHHPKLIYTIPNFHNPTGACLSSQRRRQLLLLADRYNTPILEDDYVGDLRYEGHALPALKALDPGGRVIYISTFSKMLMPGLRVGFVVAEGPLFELLCQQKQAFDLATSNLNQRAIEAYVSIGRYQSYLLRSCQVYRKRRDCMLAAIKRHLPAGLSCHPPQGGLFIWLGLPQPFSAPDLLTTARQEGVDFSLGAHHFIQALDGAQFIRLNLAVQKPETIEEGIKRLGKAFNRLKS